MTAGLAVRAGCFAVTGAAGGVANVDADAEDVGDAEDVAGGTRAALAALPAAGPELLALAPSVGVAAVEAGLSGSGALDADLAADTLAGAATLLVATAGVAAA